MGVPIFHFGQQELLKFPVASDTVIARGDLVWYDQANSTIKPASDMTWNSTLAATQVDMGNKFAGIALEASDAGDTDPVSVDVSDKSVYEIDVPSGAYKIGDTLGNDKASGNALLNQTLEAAVAASSLATVRAEAPTGSTRVRVSFFPAFSTAAPQSI